MCEPFFIYTHWGEHPAPRVMPPQPTSLSSASLCPYILCLKSSFSHLSAPPGQRTPPLLSTAPHPCTLHSSPPPQTNKTPLTHPSFSGLFVICAQRPHTTFPPAVTIPNSLTLTSIIVPFVNTPSCVYIGFCGFFFTLIMGSWTVTRSSGC